MNAREYAVFLEGRHAAAAGAGLSACPYADRDGVLWRDGLLAGLDADLPDPEPDRNGEKGAA